MYNSLPAHVRTSETTELTMKDEIQLFVTLFQLYHVGADINKLNGLQFTELCKNTSFFLSNALITALLSVYVSHVAVSCALFSIICPFIPLLISCKRPVTFHGMAQYLSEI